MQGILDTVARIDLLAQSSHTILMLPYTACRLDRMSLVKQICNLVMSLIIAIQILGIIGNITNLVIDVTGCVGYDIILSDIGTPHIRLTVHAHKLSAKLC